MKINFAVFKSKWFLYAAGGIVLFAVFYRLASSSNSSPQIVTTGAQADPVAAQLNGQIAIAQLGAQVESAKAGYGFQMAQVAANRDVTIATLQADNAAIEIAEYANLQKYIAANQASISLAAITSDLEAARISSEYGLATAETAAQTQVSLRAIDAAQFTAQLNTNAKMFEAQIGAVIDGQRLQAETQQKMGFYAAVEKVTNKNSRNRIEGLQALVGQPVTYPNKSGGFLKVLSPVTNLF